MIRDGVTFLFGTAWAFVINWKLALVVVMLLPILSVLAGLKITVSVYPFMRE